MKKVCLGEIVSVHGIKGHVKIKTHTSHPLAINDYGPLHNDKDQTVKLSIIRQYSPQTIIAAIEGVKTRNEAELLKGTHLYIQRDQLPPLDEDEFYYEDLIGLNVFDEAGRLYGQITAFQNFGAGDFIEITDPGHTKIMTYPFRDETIIELDDENQKLIIDPNFLLF